MLIHKKSFEKLVIMTADNYENKPVCC